MLKKLRTVGNGTHLWKIELRIGSRRLHRHVTDTPAGAQALYADLLKEKNRLALGLSPEPAAARMSLVDAASKYCQSMVALELDGKHCMAARKALDLLIEVVGKTCQLTQVTRQNVFDWQQRRKLVKYHDKLPKARTVNRDLGHIHAFFNWCIESQWLVLNPSATVANIRQEPPPMRAVSWQRFEALADKAWKQRPALALLLEVLGESGCRVGEAIRAKCEHVHDGVWEKIVKGKRRAKVRADAWVTAAAARGKPADPLCPREDGKHWRYQATLRAVRKLDHTITPHCLRHGRATWDIESGAREKEVQQKLAHSSPSITRRYFETADALAKSSVVVKSRPVRAV